MVQNVMRNFGIAYGKTEQDHANTNFDSTLSNLDTTLEKDEDPGSDSWAQILSTVFLFRSKLFDYKKDLDIRRIHKTASYTERPKFYRKSVLHLLKYTAYLYFHP